MITRLFWVYVIIGHSPTWGLHRRPDTPRRPMTPKCWIWAVGLAVEMGKNVWTESPEAGNFARRRWVSSPFRPFGPNARQAHHVSAWARLNLSQYRLDPPNMGYKWANQRLLWSPRPLNRIVPHLYRPPFREATLIHCSRPYRSTLAACTIPCLALWTSSTMFPSFQNSLVQISTRRDNQPRLQG